MDRDNAAIKIEQIYNENLSKEEFEQKVINIPKLLDKYDGKYDKLINAMNRKYGDTKSSEETVKKEKIQEKELEAVNDKAEKKAAPEKVKTLEPINDKAVKKAALAKEKADKKEAVVKLKAMKKEAIAKEKERKRVAILEAKTLRAEKDQDAKLTAAKVKAESDERGLLAKTKMLEREKKNKIIKAQKIVENKKMKEVAIKTAKIQQESQKSSIGVENVEVGLKNEKAKNTKNEKMAIKLQAHIGTAKAKLKENTKIKAKLDKDLAEITKRNKVLDKKLDAVKKNSSESTKSLVKLVKEVSQLNEKTLNDKNARKQMEVDLGKESQRLQETKIKTEETLKKRKIAIGESEIAEKLLQDKEIKYQAEVKPRVEAERKLKAEEGITHKISIQLKKIQLETKSLEEKIKSNATNRVAVEKELKVQQDETENLHIENDNGRIEIEKLFDQSHQDQEKLEEIKSKLEEFQAEHKEAEKVAVNVLQRREEIEIKLKSFKDATEKMIDSADKEEILAKEAEIKAEEDRKKTKKLHSEYSGLKERYSAAKKRLEIAKKTKQEIEKLVLEEARIRRDLIQKTNKERKSIEEAMEKLEEQNKQKLEAQRRSKEEIRKRKSTEIVLKEETERWIAAMSEVGVETLAREDAERKEIIETRAHANMAAKANEMKQSRLGEEQKAREAIAGHKKAQEEEGRLIKERNNFEKQIEENENKRKRAIRIAERESSNSLNAEERILAEKRAMDKARADVKKKAEARERREREERANEEFEESEKRRIRMELEQEISVELERLKGEEDKMTAKEYLLARVDVKGHLIDLNIIGRSKSKKDDLQMINGLDSGLEERLNLVGINTLEQISKMSEDMSDEVNDAIEHFPGRIRRQGWVQQAKVILEDSLLSNI
ncbi:MAG: hypothetical protein ACKVI6_02540 [Candidatus Poseidoniales archaeon]